MSELEERLSTLLSNPQLMQQVAAMAQTMAAGNADPKPPKEQVPGPPNFDPQQMQAFFQAAGQNGMDRNQEALLQALVPYLSAGRIQKLEKAMRATRMAGAASLFLNSGGLQLLTGR